MHIPAHSRTAPSSSPASCSLVVAQRRLEYMRLYAASAPPPSAFPCDLSSSFKLQQLRQTAGRSSRSARPRNLEGGARHAGRYRRNARPGTCTPARSYSALVHNTMPDLHVIPRTLTSPAIPIDIHVVAANVHPHVPSAATDPAARST